MCAPLCKSHTERKGVRACEAREARETGESGAGAGTAEGEGQTSPSTPPTGLTSHTQTQRTEPNRMGVDTEQWCLGTNDPGRIRDEWRGHTGGGGEQGATLRTWERGTLPGGGEAATKSKLEYYPAPRAGSAALKQPQVSNRTVWTPGPGCTQLGGSVTRQEGQAARKLGGWAGIRGVSMSSFPT